VDGPFLHDQSLILNASRATAAWGLPRASSEAPPYISPRSGNVKCERASSLVTARKHHRLENWRPPPAAEWRRGGGESTPHDRGHHTCGGESRPHGEVKGRPEASHRRRGRTLSPSGRRARPPKVHGLLQRPSGLSNGGNRHPQTRNLYGQLGPLPRRRVGRKPLQPFLVHALKIFLVRQHDRDTCNLI
jgi:hypothetical protein